MDKIRAVSYRLLGKYRDYNIKKRGSAKNYADSLREYAGHKLLTSEQANHFIYDKIMSGEPFFAGRFGSTELLNMRSFEFGGFIGQKYDNVFHFNHLCEWSGFFPHDIKLLPGFVAEMKLACKDVDFMAVWFHAFEDYYVKNIMDRDISISYLLNLEPWTWPNMPWSAALEGKKVLVIHPFSETIKKQYAKREKLFPGTNILPKFELHTIRAVQTLAGVPDNRFSTWFDALEWMYQEAMKVDFDIAIIGCGAYGFPLAAKLKRSQKQAIHLAGATQLLFGIKGKRWDEGDAFAYVRQWYNDDWVYPSDDDRIKNGDMVEGGCYWK